MKPKTFTVALNTQFFDCARYVVASATQMLYDLVVCDHVFRCCGAQIIGCYAPNGEHCERPLEVCIILCVSVAGILIV